MRRVRRALSALLVLFIGLTGFGAAAAWAPAPFGDVAAVERDLVTVTEQIEGTVEQRRALDRLVYLGFQGYVRDCMRRAGLDYTPPPDRPSYVGFDHLWPSTEFSSLVPIRDVPRPETGLYVAASAEAAVGPPTTANNNAPAGVPDGTTARYGKTLTGCGDVPSSRYQGLDSWPGRDQLRVDFNRTLDRANSTWYVQAALAGYVPCMGLRGFRTRTVEDLFWQLRRRVNADDLGPGRPGWEDLVDWERRAAAADARCRTTAHARGMAALAPLLADFRAEHERELSASAAAWREVATRAQA